MHDDPAGPASAAASVLLVEDNPEAREHLRETLSEEGIVVLTASNGAEAVRILERIGRPDVVIVAHEPLLVSGRELLEYLRRQSRKVPLIMMSEPGSVLEADAFLPKPLDPYRLIETMQALLQRSIARDA